MLFLYLTFLGIPFNIFDNLLGHMFFVANMPDLYFLAYPLSSSSAFVFAVNSSLPSLRCQGDDTYWFTNIRNRLQRIIMSAGYRVLKHLLL